jgi:hypothetical protein
MLKLDKTVFFFLPKQSNLYRFFHLVSFLSIFLDRLAYIDFYFARFHFAQRALLWLLGDTGVSICDVPRTRVPVL